MRNIPLSINIEPMFLTNDQEHMTDLEVSTIIENNLRKRHVNGLCVKHINRDGTGAVCGVTLTQVI